MRHGSLFSGIGGFDLAADWMGWENVFHCEWNEFGQKVLKHYWPNAISYHDITKTDFYIHRGRINILTGGFPCQPYSAAGKRLGKEDERHLWPEMLRAIREIKPTWVVGENVLGLVNWNGGMVFDEVHADLEAQGYEVQPYVLPAVSVNAPHRRDRVWFVAYSSSYGLHDQSSETDNRIGQDNQQSGAQRFSSTKGLGNEQTSSDTENTGQQARINGQGEKQFRRKNISMGTGQWDRFPTVSPIHTRDDGLCNRLDPSAISFAKWRNESIKAAGNAVVPQVVLQIFKAIQSYERSNTHETTNH